MNILATSLNPLQIDQTSKDTSKASENQGLGFSDVLKSAIDEVNNLQTQSSDIKNKLVTGDIDDIHQVMIASEKANLAFQLTVAIRNKVVDAYQEIMRMQV